MPDPLLLLAVLPAVLLLAVCPPVPGWPPLPPWPPAPVLLAVVLLVLVVPPAPPALLLAACPPVPGPAPTPEPPVPLDALVLDGIACGVRSQATAIQGAASAPVRTKARKEGRIERDANPAAAAQKPR
jgi:hypothetical protein